MNEIEEARPPARLCSKLGRSARFIVVDERIAHWAGKRPAKAFLYNFVASSSGSLLRDADANLDLPEQVNGSAIAPPGKLSLWFLPDDDPQP
jgi:hypothetical protein